MCSRSLRSPSWLHQLPYLTCSQHVCSSGVKTLNPHMLTLLRYVHCYPLLFPVWNVQQLLPEMFAKELLKILRYKVLLLSVCHLINHVQILIQWSLGFFTWKPFGWLYTAIIKRVLICLLLSTTISDQHLSNPIWSNQVSDKACFFPTLHDTIKMSS